MSEEEVLLLLLLLPLVDNDRLEYLVEHAGKTVFVVVVEHPRMVLVWF